MAKQRLRVAPLVTTVWGWIRCSAKYLTLRYALLYSDVEKYQTEGFRPTKFHSDRHFWKYFCCIFYCSDWQDFQNQSKWLTCPKRFQHLWLYNYAGHTGFTLNLVVCQINALYTLVEYHLVFHLYGIGRAVRNTEKAKTTKLKCDIQWDLNLQPLLLQTDHADITGLQAAGLQRKRFWVLIPLNACNFFF